MSSPKTDRTPVVGYEAELVAERARKVLPLATAHLSDAYYYSSLSLCALDAVFSIGVRYESTEAVVRKYCQHYSLPRTRESRTDLPPRSSQEPVSALLGRIQERGPEYFAATVVRNKQRTSARGGVLKAEALAQFAIALLDHGVRYFQDLPEYDEGGPLAIALRRVRGQGSGISVGYFWMLGGSDDLVKPDRMILGFLGDTLKRSVAVWEARSLVREATEKLRIDFAHLTPRLLDFKMWEFQRTKNKPLAGAV